MEGLLNVQLVQAKQRAVSLMVVVVQQIAHIANLCFTGVWLDGKQAKIRACGQLEEVLDRLCLLL